VSLDGVNDYISQAPLTEASVQNAHQGIWVDTSTRRLAQKLPVTAQVAGKVGFLRLRLKSVGTPAAASLRVEIQGTSSNAPSGTAITNGQSETVPVAAIGTSYGDYGFQFATPPALIPSNGPYWVVLIAYTDSGGATEQSSADADNYVAWGVDSTQAYGQPRATHDGAAWASVAQSHALDVYSDALEAAGAFSMGLWVSGFLDTASRHEGILNKRATGTGLTNQGVFLSRVVEAGGLRLDKLVDGTTHSIERAAPLPREQCFIVGVFEANGTQRLYLDGRQAVSATVGSTGVTRAPQPLHLGAWIKGDGTREGYLAGRISDAFLAAKALSAAEVWAIYSALRSAQEV
jgi:hypothetical protein